MRRGAARSLAAMFAGLCAMASAGGQEVEAASRQTPLALVELQITPDHPGLETLCQLRARVENRGERPVSALGFEVRLAGRSLPVYERQLYYQKIAPGESAEVRLFNFWTTESGRTRPPDGKLTLEVVLREARWLEVTSEQADGSADPVEVWTPAGEVPGLPASRAVTLQLP